jgi:hypothetical protein
MMAARRRDTPQGLMPTDAPRADPPDTRPPDTPPPDTPVQNGQKGRAR